MNQTISNQFIIGLPSAGKTTFLAALWHVVESREIDSSLILDHLDGDYNYLNDIRNLWADSEELPRNKSIIDEHIVSMLLKMPESGIITKVSFPDLSGESFQLQWTDRQIEQNHFDLIQEASGCLLFIHPQHVVQEILISEAQPIIDKLDSSIKESGKNKDVEEKFHSGIALSKETHLDGKTEKSNDEKEAEGKRSQIEEEYDPRKSPAQIKLVDLLQVIIKLKKITPIKIAIIVSAWDLIQEEIKPEDWVKKRLPLLYQFLYSNNYHFICKYYGISAQGGQLDNAKELRKHINPSERIKVILDEEPESNDITIPVKWVMENRSVDE